MSVLHYRKRQTLFPLEEQYGDQIEFLLINISEAGNQELWQSVMKEYEIPLQRQGVPMLFIGQNVLVGSGEIAEHLPDLIESHLRAGGLEYPAFITSDTGYPGPSITPLPPSPSPTRTIKVCVKCDDELLPSTPTPTSVRETHPLPAVEPATSTPPDPTASPTLDPNLKPIHIAYFYQIGCYACEIVKSDLEFSIRNEYPQLVIHYFNIAEEPALAEWMGKKAGLPETRRMAAPAVFVAQEGLYGWMIHFDGLLEMIGRYAETGAEPTWQRWEEEKELVEASIIGRFLSFGVLTVLAAGLIDGLNPCAFATLIFFISYLAFMGRRGVEVLLVGGAFTLGVFLTNLSVGLGLARLLEALPFLSIASRWVYGITAAACLILAFASLHDWLKARRGSPEKMRLRLPDRLRKWINKMIRRGSFTRAFVPAALFTGIVIAFIELACTGQVYLPTILFVLGQPDLKSHATFFLVLYNLMFIVPLLIVFVAAYFGTTSQQLVGFINRHTAGVKLATAGLFLLLATWMVLLLV